MFKIPNNTPFNYLLAPTESNIKLHNEASELIKKYGKDDAIQLCSDSIDSYHNQIGTLRFYDSNVVGSLQCVIYKYNEIKFLCEHWIDD